MKKTIKIHALILVSLVLLFTCHCFFDSSSANKNTDVLIATSDKPDTICYYVAVDGSDSNPGTLSAPFQTIERAKREVASVIANANADIYVYIRAGDYFLDSTISFSSADSGANGYTVYYSAYPGDNKPRIIGGKKITGWEPYENGIYKTNLNDNLSFNRLYEEQAACTIARYPKKSADMGNGPYLQTSDNEAPDYKTQFRFNEGDFPVFDWTKTPAQVYIMPSGRDITDNDKRLDSYVIVSPVSNIDWDNRIVTTTQVIRDNEDNWMSLGYGASYFIQGAKEFLTDPGEFFLDNQTHTLYYKPMNTAKPIGDLEIIAPTVSRIFELNGAGNISFEGLQIEDTDCASVIPMFQIMPYKLTGALISLSSSQNITVDGCNLFNAGESAVLVNNSNSGDVKIINNHIKNSGYTVINMPDSGNTRFTVENNLIENVGLASGYSYAFGNWGNSYVNFAHNKVDGCVGPATFMYDGESGSAGNCSISYNEFTHCLQFGHDLGVIYCYRNTGLDNIINYNYIHDCGNDLGPAGQITHALYLDDYASNFTVTNNIFANVKSRNQYFPIYVKGQNNVIYNNIMYQSAKLNSGALGGIVTYDMDNPANSPINNITLAHNIYYLPGANYFYSIWGWDTEPWDTDTFAMSDYNVFYFPGVDINNYRFQDTHPNTTATTGVRGTVERWQNWDGKNFDKNSLFGYNPLFTDSQNGDFALRADSPALILGFVNIDQSLIGLYSQGNPPENPDLPPLAMPVISNVFAPAPEREASASSSSGSFELATYIQWPDSPQHQIYWFTFGFAYYTEPADTPQTLSFDAVRQAKELRIEFESEPKGPIQFAWVGDGYDSASRGQDGWWSGWNQTDNINAGQTGTILIIDLSKMNLWDEAVSGTGLRIILGYWADTWGSLKIKSAVLE
ncbi:MAG: right-handed parallel beta-helix repeat-containing protein [Oscillospiraceae bacterium]|nr:right-handed parallel beta-helix repeat-containing protein [Oscillospiraceae bacterium]